jgi:hypothetical protein
MKMLRLLALAALVLAGAPSAHAGDPSGAWKWTITAPTGDVIDVSLKLELKDGKMTGTYSNRFGDAPIKDASFEDDVVAFSVDRRLDGDTFTVKYSGKLDGDTIKGSIDLPGFGGGAPVKMDWNASRAK